MAEIFEIPDSIFEMLVPTVLIICLVAGVIAWLLICGRSVKRKKICLK